MQTPSPFTGISLQIYPMNALPEHLKTLIRDVHGESVETFSVSLTTHPAFKDGRWLCLTDDSSGRALSTLCLIPWEWNYNGTLLRVAELGIVATAADSRNRGYSRYLVECFRKMAKEQAYDLAGIEGIAGYYGRFGYRYAIPLDNHFRVELSDIEGPGVGFRPARDEDWSWIRKEFERHQKNLDISVVRNDAHWSALRNPREGSETACDRYCAETPKSKVYVSIARSGFGKGMIVNEASPVEKETAIFLLRGLRDLCRQKNKPFIRLNLPESHPLIVEAKKLGCDWSKDDLWQTYTWQILTLDWTSLFRKLAPLWKQRLGNSTFSLGLLLHYGPSWTLTFEHGNLSNVLTGTTEGVSTLSIAEEAFYRLFFGDFSLPELTRIFPDTIGDRFARDPFETLFPKQKGFIYPIY